MFAMHPRVRERCDAHLKEQASALGGDLAAHQLRK